IVLRRCDHADARETHERKSESQTVASRHERLPGTLGLPIAAAIGLGPEQLALRRGDVKLVELAAAEAALIRLVGRQRMALDDGSARCDPRDHRPRAAALPAATGNNVAVGIEAQTLDAAVDTAMVLAERMQHRWMIEAAVGANRI